ncbi:MAG: CheR family methyltransferase [Actinomycetota bacterium]
MTLPGAPPGSDGRNSNSQTLPADVPQLLAQRVGLRLDEGDRDKVERLLQTRAGRHSSAHPADLASLPEDQLTRELERIAAHLTPGETFFFRDHGQFELLRFKLLPELIKARRNRRTLRLWSAGCASGEEAYSLAMAVDALLPDRRGWHIAIIGSDINEESLAKARQGRYGNWSFRLTPNCLRERYFRRHGDDWVLTPAIRSLVTFRRGNLVTDPLPDPLLRDIDLILCRNVLIYFQPEAVRTVAAKLAACLAEGGYLVTGHTELMGIRVPGLAGRLFPDGMVYQRVEPSPRPISRPWTSKPVAPPPASPPASPPPIPAPLPETAQALADRGDYEAAEASCRQTIATGTLDPASHFLLAQLAQLRGDYREAESQLDRTLYLAPDNVAAYLELAALHERAGDDRRAKARRRAALDLLRRLPPEARVEPFEARADELAAWLVQTEAL